MKKGVIHKKNKIKVAFTIIITVMLSLAIIIAMYMVHINNIIAALIKNKDSLILNYNFNVLILSNSNVKSLNNLKEFKILKNNLEFNVEFVDNINWFNIYNVNSKHYSNDTNYYAYKIVANDNKIDEKIKVKLPEKLRDKQYVDVYIKSNDKYIIYDEYVEVNNEEIIINTQRNIEQYLITYIPLTDIKIENDEISINRTQIAELKYEIYPSNATQKKISCVALSDIVTVDGNEIKANTVGKTKIKLYSKDIEKYINVEVNEIVSDIIVDNPKIILKIGESANITATPKPENAANKELVWKSSNEEIVSVNNGKVTLNKEGYAIITVSTKEKPIVTKEIIVSSYKIYEQPEKFNIMGLTYIEGILVVNKKYSLPKDFNPGLNQMVVNAYNDMKNAAKKEGVTLQIVSGFRSYNTQKYTYNNFVNIYGVSYASISSAKAGHSEHQTGLALDISMLNQSFGDTYEGRWLANNCAKYGFIIRYPKGKESITGYMYEPWHIRYVGTILAEKITASGLCLEEYLKIN